MSTNRATREGLSVLAIGLGGICALTAVYTTWWHVDDPTTAALSYLIILLFVASSAALWVALATTIAASLMLDFFFFPPVGTFNIRDPEDWVAFITFVVASLVASHLSSTARRRQHEITMRRDELGRLLDLSRDVLVTTGRPEALASMAALVKTRFLFEYVAIELRIAGTTTRHEAGVPPEHAVMTVTDLPRQPGSRTSGSLTVAGHPVAAPTLDTLASLVAIAIDRILLLEDRHQAEFAQRSIELKSMLLASLAHDLRTPLTATRLAVSNLQNPNLTEAQRAGQSDVALRAVDRLARLFQNILEMTHIDAGNIAVEPRWVSPMEIVEAARAQVLSALNGRHVDVVDGAKGAAAYVDARLTSAALAHVLENAAHYSPPESTIGVSCELDERGLSLSVRDHGAGIDPADLPHLFDRFYRGGRADRHPLGTGMGLAIARGLLQAEGGRISPANCADGGAIFSIVVPAAHRSLARDDDLAEPRLEPGGLPPDSH